MAGARVPHWNGNLVRDHDTDNQTGADATGVEWADRDSVEANAATAIRSGDDEARGHAIAIDELFLHRDLDVRQHARVELDRSAHAFEAAQLEVVDVIDEVRAVEPRRRLAAGTGTHTFERAARVGSEVGADVGHRRGIKARSQLIARHPARRSAAHLTSDATSRACELRQRARTRT